MQSPPNSLTKWNDAIDKHNNPSHDVDLLMADLKRKAVQHTTPPTGGQSPCCNACHLNTEDDTSHGHILLYSMVPECDAEMRTKAPTFSIAVLLYPLLTLASFIFILQDWSPSDNEEVRVCFPPCSILLQDPYSTAQIR